VSGQDLFQIFLHQALASLRDVLSAFHANGLPSTSALNDSMHKDLKKLELRQHSSGGWGFWIGEQDTWPYLSVHVAHAPRHRPCSHELVLAFQCMSRRVSFSAIGRESCDVVGRVPLVQIVTTWSRM
jgi:hypothetical protein